MTNDQLQALIEKRLAIRWNDFASKHPHLAAAIDQTRLIEESIPSIRDDPEFIAAMKQADLEQSGIDAVLKMIDIIERTLRRFLLV